MTIQTCLKELFTSSEKYHMKVQPHTHVRVTHGDKWIFKSTDEYLKDYDSRKGARSFNRKQQLVRSNAHREELTWVCQRDRFDLVNGNYIIVFMKHMPKTWRKGVRKPGKRDLRAWTPMLTRPDVDNFYKKLADSLVREDNLLWCAAILKIWIPDEIEEGTYFINVPEFFSSIVAFLKQSLSS